MPLRTLPYREVKRKLEAAGFIAASRKGSHVYLHTGKAEFPRLKLSGVDAIVSIDQHERRYDMNRVLTELISAITGIDEYLANGIRRLEAA